MTNTLGNVKSFIMEDVKEMETISKARKSVITHVDQVLARNTGRTLENLDIARVGPSNNLGFVRENVMDVHHLKTSLKARKNVRKDVL